MRKSFLYFFCPFRQVNGWVRRITNGKIEKLFGESGKNIAILDEIWESELGDWELFPSLSSQFRKKLYRSISIPECLGKRTNLIAWKWQYCSLRTETLPGPGSRYCFPKKYLSFFPRVSFLFFFLHIRPSSYGKLYMAEAAAASRVEISKCHKAISRLFSPFPPYLEKRKKRKKRNLFQLWASLDFFHGQPTAIFPYKPAHFFCGNKFIEEEEVGLAGWQWKRGGGSKNWETRGWEKGKKTCLPTFPTWIILWFLLPHFKFKSQLYFLKKLKLYFFAQFFLANGVPLPLPRSKSGELKRGGGGEESLGKEREEESSCEFFLTFFAGYG